MIKLGDVLVLKGDYFLSGGDMKVFDKGQILVVSEEPISYRGWGFICEGVDHSECGHLPEGIYDIVGFINDREILISQSKTEWRNMMFFKNIGDYQKKQRAMESGEEKEIPQIK